MRVKKEKYPQMEIKEYSDRYEYRVVDYKGDFEFYFREITSDCYSGGFVEFCIVVNKKTTWWDILCGNWLSDRKRKAQIECQMKIDEIKKEREEPIRIERY